MHDIVRWNERALEKALRTRRVVVISGARQCGKSTSRRFSPVQNEADLSISSHVHFAEIHPRQGFAIASSAKSATDAAVPASATTGSFRIAGDR